MGVALGVGIALGEDGAKQPPDEARLASIAPERDRAKVHTMRPEALRGDVVIGRLLKELCQASGRLGCLAHLLTAGANDLNPLSTKSLYCSLYDPVVGRYEGSHVELLVGTLADLLHGAYLHRSDGIVTD